MFSLLLGVLCIATFNKAFRNTMSKRNLSMKETAALLGEDPAQLQRELQGIGHLSMARVANMPRDFVQTLALEMVREFGFPPEVVIAQQVERAL